MRSPEFDGYERARWAGRAAAYERSFARLCAHPADALLDAAGVDKGRRVLDVGTGTGTVAALAAARGATVLAADAEPSMLDVAAPRLPTGATVLATLPVLPFPGEFFDVAVGNFVINHVGNPAAAVAEMARVTRRGGRIAVTVWPSPPPTAQRLWNDIFDAAGVERPAQLPRLDDANDFPRTEKGLSALLEGAGLAAVMCTTVSWTLRIDPDDWWAGPAAGLGMPGLILARQPQSVVAEVRAAFDELTGPYRTDGGLLALPTSALLARGTRGRPA
ncbi:class I SAM-dependent methyltransferase [Actinoplanes sp. URMC 104]|uniref:class I SAM-dependent methyltransferase n=1 Tax=Actinoplanes sp. URMC 104 TaxID=3423409 RepID=UPI003F1A29EF